MVMPSKEKNHVITKDREQGEQQTIGTCCEISLLRIRRETVTGLPSGPELDSFYKKKNTSYTKVEVKHNALTSSFFDLFLNGPQPHPKIKNSAAPATRYC